jgi:hypothetical protein
MHEIPAVPAVADAPDSLFEDGHLWIQEYVDGGPLRVQLQDSGLLEFGTGDRLFHGDVPLEYRHAVRHVRERFDRDPLREALDEVTSVTLLGVATHGGGVAYDRDRTPAFLVVDVWSATDEGLLPPDAVDTLAERLGLTALPAVRKEVRAVDFDVAAYEFPPSNYRDGAAASVLVRNKTGDRARYTNAAVQTTMDPSTDSPADLAADLAADLVTAGRVERALDSTDGAAPDADAVTERVVELAAHDAADVQFGDQAVDLDAFRREVGVLVRERLRDA